MNHKCRWRTVRPLKHEGEGEDYSIHFLRKCLHCAKEEVKVYYPAVFLSLFDKAQGQREA